MTDHSFFFLFSNLDITQSDEETTQIGIIAGSVGGGFVLIAFLLALVICIVVVCKHGLKWYQTKETADIVKKLINKNKSGEKIKVVLDALRKQFREIAAEGENGKAKENGKAEENRKAEVDGPVEEVDGHVEMVEIGGKPQNRKYQILIDFINDMNTLLIPT